jgi:phytoene dehydrogenase-like protein
MATTKKADKPAKAAKAARTPKDEAWDAIVVGGGHNGLVNGAYLAKSGLRTLVLERRHIVGGAAITEELRPGFSFTTFSYALSLFRPDIVQELDLVKHGFMPLLMPSTFIPGEDGEYLLMTQDHAVNQQSIRRLSKHDADAYDRYESDIGKVLQAFKPLMDAPAPNLFSDDPEELLALAALGARLKALPKDVLHNALRLVTGSAADFLDDYFENDLLKGWMGSSSTVGTKVGPRSPGSGLSLLFLMLGEHDGALGAWSFHKGGNGGLTQVLARAARSYGAEIRTEAPVDSVITRDGRVLGVALADGTELHAPVVVSALDPRRTFTELVDPRELPTDLVDAIRRYRFQGVSSTSRSPGCPGTRRSPRAMSTSGASSTSRPRSTTWSGPSTRRSTAGTAAGHTSTPASRASWTRTWPRRASTSCPASRSTPRTSSRARTGTASGRTWATSSSAPWSRSSRASRISCSSARWSLPRTSRPWPA